MYTIDKRLRCKNCGTSQSVELAAIDALQREDGSITYCFPSVVFNCWRCGAENRRSLMYNERFVTLKP